MGSIRRKTFTKPMPSDAKIVVRKGQRFAEWRDGDGKRRLERLNDAGRLIVEAETYTAKFRDGSGIVREVATGCRDADAARQVLAELERRAERIRANVITADEDRTLTHQATDVGQHFDAYRQHLATKGKCSRPKELDSQLRTVADACAFRTLADIDAGKFESWLSTQATDGMSAARRNKYRGTWVAFCNWAVRSHRLLSNPLRHVAKADEATDTRRQRRAMTEPELRRLLYVATWRPLAEFGREVQRLDADNQPTAAKSRRTWKAKSLSFDDLAAAVERARERLADNPAFVAELKLRGRERALIYKSLVLTGLRRGELASLTLASLDLAADPAFVTLAAADEKNRQGNSLPLRGDLADDLRAWLAEKAAGVRQDATGNVATIKFDPNAVRAGECGRSDVGASQGMPPSTPLFEVPAGLVRILDRDLKAAGIPKRDERGRTLDVHAFRHTFGTLLSAGGVAPRTAQAAMRHSQIDLTMNVYTDPKLLDVHGAVDALPSLPLNAPPVESEARANGTTDASGFPLAPMLAPTPGNFGQSVAILDNAASSTPTGQEPEKAQKTGVFQASSEWAMRGSNTRLPPCKGGALAN